MWELQRLDDEFTTYSFRCSDSLCIPTSRNRICHNISNASDVIVAINSYSQSARFLAKMLTL